MILTEEVCTHRCVCCVPVLEVLLGFGGRGQGGLGGAAPSSVPVSAAGVLAVRGALPARSRAAIRLRLRV